MTEVQMKEFFLQDALNTFNLPLFVTTSSKCFLKGGFAFEAGVKFTVLQRDYVELLFGVDWSGNNIRLNTYEKADLIVEIVDEIYPTSLEELIELLPKINYILPKVLFDPNLARPNLTKKRECFRLHTNEKFDDLSKIALISHTGESIYPSLQSLLNRDRFVFVNSKETLSLEMLLSRDLTPGIMVRFINGLETQVPYGNIILEGRHIYDSILTVKSEAENPNKLLYEIFQLDSEIKVFLSDQPIPTHVAELGEYGSNVYLHKIEQLLFAFHYEIYSPRFYGRLVMDISAGNQVKNVQGVNELSSEKIVNLKPVNNASILEDKIKERTVRPTSLFLPSAWRLSLKKKKDLRKKVSSSNTSPMIEEIPNSSSLDDVFDSSSGTSFDRQSTYAKSVINDYDDDEIQNITDQFQERANRRKQSYEGTKAILPIKRPPINEKQGENTSTSFLNEIKDEKNSENDLYGYEMSYKPIHIPRKERSASHFDKFEELNGEKKLAKSLEEKDLHEMVRGRRRYNTERTSQEVDSSMGTDQSKSGFDRSIDSGIDSPDAKKNEEFVINHILANQKKLSKSDTSLAEKIVDKEYLYQGYGAGNSELANEIYSNYTSVPYSFVTPRRFTTDMQKKEIESLEEIASCSIDDIVNRLKGLQLGKFAQNFRRQLINGRLLRNLTEEALREMHFSYFEARKLYKYVHGWRVNIMNCPVNLENSQVKEWSVNDVKKVMKIINLEQLGTFAVENQIDGVLLEDLIRNNYIKTLENDHNIRLTIVETERLRGYVYKELKYRTHEINRANISNRR